MEDKPGKNHGKEIGDIVRDTLKSGDLSRLSKLGPAIEDAVKDIPKVTVEVRRDDKPAVRPEAAPTPPRKPWQGQATPYARQVPSLPAGIGRVVLGAIGLGVFGIGTLIFAGTMLASGLRWLPMVIGFGAMAVVSAGVLSSGLARNKLKSRMRKIYTVLGQRPVRTYEELAAETGMEPKQIRRDVKAARRMGLMTDVRSDAADTMLICGEEAWNHYQQSEKTAQQRAAEEAERQRRLADPATAGIEAFRSEGIATIRKIRNANEAIPGEEISGKLSRLEATCARIFTYVEEHPEKLGDTRKFMSYYLPTTLKLVEKYRQYEEMADPPANVMEAKGEIEDSLDTIDDAFNNLLESLYAHDTLDVSTDIAVMKQMLEQEGLTGKQFDIEADEQPELKI